MVDLHLHSDFSFDGKSSLEDMSRAAEALGLGHIAFCEHADIDYPLKGYEFKFNIPAYVQAVERSRLKHPQLEIALGIEAGFMPGAERKMLRFLAALPVDYVINSVHAVGDKDPYFEDYFIGKTREQAYSDYLEAVLASLDVPYEWSSLGHLGYVYRKAPYPAPAIGYLDYPDILDLILGRLIVTGHALEVNTSSVITCGQSMPSESIIKRYRQLGGELITLGSDAHSPARVGQSIKTAEEFLRSLGYKHTAVYKNMKPMMIALD